VSIAAAGLAVFEDGQPDRDPLLVGATTQRLRMVFTSFSLDATLDASACSGCPGISLIAPELLARLNRSDLVIAHMPPSTSTICEKL